MSWIYDNVLVIAFKGMDGKNEKFEPKRNQNKQLCIYQLFYSYILLDKEKV